MDQKHIDRINELARKSREIGLTREEKAEQQQLREQYLADVRRNFKATLESITAPPEKFH